MNLVMIDACVLTLIALPYSSIWGAIVGMQVAVGLVLLIKREITRDL